MSGTAFGTAAGQPRRSAFQVCGSTAGHGSAATCGATARSPPRNLGAASCRATVGTGHTAGSSHAGRTTWAARATRHPTGATGTGAGRPRAGTTAVLSHRATRTGRAGTGHGTRAGTTTVLSDRATRAGAGYAIRSGRADHGTAGSSGAHRLCGPATRDRRHTAGTLAQAATGDGRGTTGAATRNGRGATGHGRTGPGTARAVRTGTAVPAGVLLLRRERSGGRHIGAGRAAAGAGLFGYRHATGDALVLAGPRRAAGTLLATAGTLDHTGGAVRHRAGTTRNGRGAGTLTSGDDRRDDGGGPDRAAVTRADAARAGHVRGAGEATDLRLVRVGGTACGTAPARLAAGPSAGAASAVLAGLCPGTGPTVTGAADEPDRAGVVPGIGETVRADQRVRAGAEVTLRRATPTGSLVTGRRGMAGPVPRVALRGGPPGPGATAVPAGRLLEGARLVGAGPAAPPRPVVGRARNTVGARRGTAGALLVPVRKGPGAMHGILPAGNGTGVMDRIETTLPRTRPPPTRHRTGILNRIETTLPRTRPPPTRHRTGILNRVEAAGDRAGAVCGATRNRARVVHARNRAGAVHRVVRARLRRGVVSAGRRAGPSGRDRVGGAEAVSRRGGRGQRTDARARGPGARRDRAHAGRGRRHPGNLGRVAGERHRRLAGEHLAGRIDVHLTAGVTRLGGHRRAAALRRSGPAGARRCLSRHRAGRAGGSSRWHLSGHARPGPRRHLPRHTRCGPGRSRYGARRRPARGSGRGARSHLTGRRSRGHLTARSGLAGRSSRWHLPRHARGGRRGARRHLAALTPPARSTARRHRAGRGRSSGHLGGRHRTRRHRRGRNGPALRTTAGWNGRGTLPTRRRRRARGAGSLPRPLARLGVHPVARRREALAGAAGKREVVVGHVVRPRRDPAGLAGPALPRQGAGADRVAFLFGHP
ncbi:hypothetical protein [Actinoplanes flavus]|uniref:Uncharacterized protein n=1 Tax=Actinoplanes flavus TaxID=2820290 RepID=A0ABS3UQL4_9ACTN|nr:hypothetical protein [Actinoplanes flavus]MBO3741057.1 hypothetical protein [Actinoplanes flavus]